MEHRRIASDGRVGLGMTLTTIARELAMARETALDLQMTVAELIAGPGPGASDALFRLQDLDRLAQTLGDLSRFVGAIAPTAPGSWHVDAQAATAALHLRDLAARLTGCEDARAREARQDEDDLWLDAG